MLKEGRRGSLDRDWGFLLTVGEEVDSTYSTDDDLDERTDLSDAGAASAKEGLSPPATECVCGMEIDVFFHGWVCTSTADGRI